MKNRAKYNFTVVLALFTIFGFNENAWNIQPESIKLVWVLSEFFLWSYGPKTSEKHEKYKFTVVLALFTKFDSRQKLWNFQPESIKLVWDDLELFL